MLKKNVILLLLGAALTLFVPSMPATAYAATVLTTQEEEDLRFIREEEKVARDTYLTSYDLWGLAIFSNIASSEQSHMDAVLKLLKKYGVADPAASTAIGEFTNPTLQSLYDTLAGLSSASALGALKVGGLIEETDIHDITAAVARSEHPDITKTYETLMCGSRNHLRGFATALQAQTGEAYIAQVLPQAEVDQILASANEKCGRKSTQASASKGRP